jgi:hypothetical protein
MRPLLILVPVLLLSACNDRDDANKQGTSLNINAKGEDGSDDVQINADGNTGKVAIKVPGFEGKLSVPKVMLDHSDFDIDGVKLYPGSKVTTVNVNADDTGGKDETKVNILFTSPADVAKVAAYFRKALADKDMAVTGSDASLSGKTKDGEPFVIALTAAAPGQTSGSVVIDTK